jgi:hypothetical protein
MRNFRRVTRVQAVFLAVMFVVNSPQIEAADEWRSPALKLAKQISEKLDRGQAVALSFQNLSSASTEQAGRASKALEAELLAAGHPLRAKDGATPPDGEASIAQVKATLAENLRGFVWVAEIVKGESHELVMIGVPRAAPAAIETSVAAMLLRSHKTMEQAAPILDFALIDVPNDPPRLLVLEPSKVVFYIFDSGQWKMQQSAPLLEPPNWPRDRRGRLRMARGSFEVFLPGRHCFGMALQTLRFECSDDKEVRPWEFRLGDDQQLEVEPTPGRNFFDWKTSRRESFLRRVPPFFSAAGIKVNRTPVWAVAGIDGLARLYDAESGTEPFATFSGWGSDIAGLETDCGSNWQILATRAGDWTERDTLQAFEIVDKQPVAVSPPTEFPGPIVALWQSEAEGTAAAVIHNLQTGRYEAHTVSLSCGH